LPKLFYIMAEKTPETRPALKSAPLKKTLSKTKVKENGVDSNGNYDEVKSLSPEYLYTTDQRPENFNNTPFDPLGRPKNDLSPANPIKPDRPKGVSHDEGNLDDYKNLGLFSEEVRYIFDPTKRSDENKVDRPVSTLYESTRDNTQLDTPQVIRTECLCKDGTKRMGWLDIRSGQKDCSPCKKSVFNNPNIYKNYKTKRSTPNFSGKSVPLRKQVGVSHFGDVNMKGCQTGNAEQTLERRNAVSTLNNITNIDTQDSIGGSTITAPQNVSGVPISLYDNLKSNVYGL